MFAGPFTTRAFGREPDNSRNKNLLHILIAQGVILSSPCGGGGTCGKCRVRIIEGKITNGAQPDEDGWVLACQVWGATDLVIEAGELSSNELGSDELGSGELGANELGNNEISSPAEISHKHGVALDLGTTTISARLIDLDTAGVLETISQLNNQRIFGADVMSRIGAAREGKTAELYAAINSQIEKLLSNFIDKWKIRKIEKLTVSGNTVMMHLFLNVDPSPMGVLPFTPVFLEEREIPGIALSLPVDKVILLPSISAFVGADITSGLAALDIPDSEKDLPSLLVDIGTNGEMALLISGDEGLKILSCSTAAGPAFEGAEISCGMGGVRGAISSVSMNPDKTEGDSQRIIYSTIGGAEPRGICGSGLIDAVALMLSLGIIDETGYMEEYENGFEIAPGVIIINRDIRQFQLAKSAILSGIMALCKKAELETSDIKNIYIAGGFGFFINKKNAVAAGLLPGEFLDNIHVMGNLSLRGAEEALFSGDFIERCKKIVSSSIDVDLSSDPFFMEEYTKNMIFPL